MAPALAAVGIVAAVGSIVHALRSREWRLARLRNHVIVCGLGRTGSILAREFANSGTEVVGIDSGEDPSHLEHCRRHGVLVLTGDAADRGMLMQAALERARFLVAVTGSDGTNAEIALKTLELLPEGSGSLERAFVSVVDPEFHDLLERYEQDGAATRLEVFSVFDRAADQMLKDGPALAPPTWSAEKQVVVVGLGDLGKSLVSLAATHWRDACSGTSPLRIKVLDRHASRKINYLRLRSRELEDHWSFSEWNEDLDGPLFDAGDYLSDGEKLDVGAVYVCLDNDHLALKTTLTLTKHLPATVPLIVRMSESEHGLAKLLPDRGRVHSFGMHELSCKPEPLLGIELPLKRLRE